MFNHVKLEKPFPKIEKKMIDGKRFYITEDCAVKLPSVTTVLSKADKDKNVAIQKWKKRVGEDEAKRIVNNSAARGTGMHNACDQYLQNKPITEIKLMPNAKEFFNTLKPELNNINNIVCQEQPMFSERLGLAGTVDLIAEYKGVLSVIDYKNAKSFRTEKMIWTYFLQATAYSLFYNEWLGYPAVKQIVILMAVENEPIPQIFVKNPKEFIVPLFQAISSFNSEKINNPQTN
jgi:hypothetical protein